MSGQIDARRASPTARAGKRTVRMKNDRRGHKPAARAAGDQGRPTKNNRPTSSHKRNDRQGDFLIYINQVF